MSDKLRKRIINETAESREIGRKREKREKLELVISSRFLDPGSETRLEMYSHINCIHCITLELVCVSSLRIDVESMKISAIRVNGSFQ